MSRYWPPSQNYTLFFLDLEPYAKSLSPRFINGLRDLAELIDGEWCASKRNESPASFIQGTEIAECLRALSQDMEANDKAALLARADYVQYGPSEGLIDQLLRAEQQLVVFAGSLSTWFGKEARGRPSAFAFQRSRDLGFVLDPLLKDNISIEYYLEGLHKGLFFTEPPEFMAGDLLFMAGEANLHPKHIAYFLPEDEGVKRSPCKRTFYFSNSHLAKLDNIAWPLFSEFVQGGTPFNDIETLRLTVPAAGVLAHELGHFVQRETTSYAALNKKDRWVSIVLQEAAADVFGTLFLSEVWASRLGVTVDQAISYYLADSLGYINRGVGLFPDSDGMVLQLNYLVECGAISIKEGPQPSITFSAQAVIAGLRSLARVLGDTLLDGCADRAHALHARYGPTHMQHLMPIVSILTTRAPQSIEYIQEYVAYS